MEFLVMASAPKRPRRLKGKGPTPKASDRPYHKAAKAKPKSRNHSPNKQNQVRRGRDGDGEKHHVDTIAGRNAVLDALRAEVPVRELVAATGIDIDERIKEIVDLARNQGLPIREVARQRLDSMTGITHHQGIALVAKPFAYSSQKEMFERARKREGAKPLFVAVDGVTDPRNIGAIVRSAVAFGADGVLIPERRSASITAAAWKASAGAVARVPIAQVTNLVRSIEDAKALGCFVVGLDSESSELISSLPVADEGIYLVVGSEGKGLSRLVRDHCDLIVAIAISSKIESLNASVATSIALYEIAGKRK